MPPNGGTESKKKNCAHGVSRHILSIRFLFEQLKRPNRAKQCAKDNKTEYMLNGNGFKSTKTKMK